MRRAPALLLLAACDGPDKADDARPERGTEPTRCVQAAVLEAERASGAIPLTAAFTASAACGGEWASTWDFGDGATAEGALVEHTWLGSGTYTVSLSMTDGVDTLTASTTIDVAPAACPELEAPRVVGTVAHDELVEASGLAEGRANRGLLWSHNDSGDTPRLFVLDQDGTSRGTFLLEGAPNGDWEDLAAGEDADGAPVLFVGDIGSNGTTRDTLVVYVVPEPPVGAEAADLAITDWWSFELAFPDAAALDANTLLWDPATGDLYLAANEADATGIYRAAAPFSPDSVVLVERVAGFTFGVGGLEGGATPTGGAISPLGDLLAIRTADTAWAWRRDRTAGIDAAWAGEPCPLAVAEEPRGEAIAFSADGAGYYTLGEEAHQPLWYTGIVPPCDGLEPAIVVAAARFGVADPLAFAVDTTCVPAGLASASWDFGDGETSEERAPTHLYLASGTYTVTLTVVDGAGDTESTTTEVEILPAACPTPGAVETWGEVESDEIVEASGVGHSALNPGVVWTHNDSSDTARLFALSESGGHLGEFTVVTDNRDWEDMSLGWDETLGAPAIYVGDFGDNGESRDDITVLVVPEPSIALADVPVTAELTTFTQMTLLYPDGAHNAETLMHDPVTGDLYVVTKDYEGSTSVYRKPAPHVDGVTSTLDHVADLVFGEDPLPGSGATTGGDISPLGDRIAIRTYSHAWAWRRDQAFSVAEAFAGEPCDLGAPDEPQGEALGFTRDGAGYLTLSEGEHVPLHFVPLD